jgi:tRNA-dihydrouridine synthase B
MTAPNRPQRLDIAGLVIEPALLLAPMEGLTDLPLRRMLRGLGGVGLPCTEFVASEGLIRDVPHILAMTRLDPDEHPAAIQIYGRRPESMAQAASMALELGAEVVDINMGCPSRKVCAHSGGAALLREPELVRAIVRAVRAVVPGPLTVKIRTGWSSEQRNGPEIARICAGEGADAITVHWRTRMEAFKGAMQPERIAEVVRAVDIPVVGNGDVVDVDSAARMLDVSGCHGLMVGRGAVRNPWLLGQLSCWLAGRPVSWPSAAERQALVLDHMDRLEASCRSEKGALGRSKKFCGYYTRGLPHGAPLRQAVFHSGSMAEARDHLRRYFEGLERWEAERGGPLQGPGVTDGG